MNKWKIFSLTAVVLLGLTIRGTDVALADSVKPVSTGVLEKQSHEIQSIQNDIVVLEEENGYLNNSISINEGSKIELEEMIQKKENEIEAIQYALNTKIKTYEENIAVAKERMVTLQVKNSPFGIQFIESLLKAESLTNLIDRTYGMTVLLNSHTSFMNHLVQERNQIETEEKVVMKEKEEMEQGRKEVEDLLIQLEVDKEVSKKQMEELESKKKELTEEHDISNIAYQSLQEVRVRDVEEPPLQKQKETVENKVQVIASHSFDEMPQTPKTPQTSSISVIKNVLGTIPSTSRSNLIKQILDDATSYIGVPYKWGGATPSGFDCSGLIQYVYAKSGINLPRVTTAQEQVGTSISFKELEPGDLLFWGERGDSYHNAIYIGDEQFIHAPQPGKNVQIMSFSEYMPSFAKRIIQKELPVPPIFPEEDKRELTPHDIDMLG